MRTTSSTAHHGKALSTLSQKSATVAENGEATATVAEFGDSRTSQCGQGLTTPANGVSKYEVMILLLLLLMMMMIIINCALTILPYAFTFLINLLRFISCTL